MAQIHAYVNFNGNTREAMTFYQNCLGGELDLVPVSESAMAEKIPASMHQKIFYSCLAGETFLLMASDMTWPEGFIQGNTISLSLSCTSEKEINRFFHSLSCDGNIREPLRNTFRGSVFGCITDKYGVTWLLNFDKKIRNIAPVTPQVL